MKDTNQSSSRSELKPILTRPGESETLAQFQFRVLSALGLEPTQELKEKLAREQADPTAQDDEGSRRT